VAGRDDGLWWNQEPVPRIEREEVGDSPPTVTGAVFLPDVELGDTPVGRCATSLSHAEKGRSTCSGPYG